MGLGTGPCGTFWGAVDEWFACRFLDLLVPGSNPGVVTFSTRNNPEYAIHSNLLRPTKPFILSGSKHWQQLRLGIKVLSSTCGLANNMSGWRTLHSIYVILTHKLLTVFERAPICKVSDVRSATENVNLTLHRRRVVEDLVSPRRTSERIYTTENTLMHCRWRPSISKRLNRTSWSTESNVLDKSSITRTEWSHRSSAVRLSDWTCRTMIPTLVGRPRCLSQASNMRKCYKR